MIGKRCIFWGSFHITVRMERFDHLFALFKLARKMGMNKVYVHALIGRRGEKPESGAIYVDKVRKRFVKSWKWDMLSRSWEDFGL